jgi:hypothetical protein
MVAGVTMLIMAALALSGGELTVGNINVRAVVLFDALSKVVFGAGLLALARIAVRQLGGAALGIGVLGALGAAYLSAELALRIPGVSVQVTLPGANVLNSANLDAALRSVRAPWHEPVEIGLAALCLATLVVAMGSLLPAVARPLLALDRPHPGRPPSEPVTEPVSVTSRGAEAATPAAPRDLGDAVSSSTRDAGPEPATG